MEELLDVARDDLVRVLHVAHGVVDHANGDSVMVSPPLPEDPDVEALSALVRREFADEAPVLGRLVSALAREAASRVDAHVDALLQWMELLPAKARVVVLVVLFEWQRKAKGSARKKLLRKVGGVFYSLVTSALPVSTSGDVRSLVERTKVAVKLWTDAKISPAMLNQGPLMNATRYIKQFSERLTESTQLIARQHEVTAAAASAAASASGTMKRKRSDSSMPFNKRTKSAESVQYAELSGADVPDYLDAPAKDRPSTEELEIGQEMERLRSMQKKTRLRSRIVSGDSSAMDEVDALWRAEARRAEAADAAIAARDNSDPAGELERIVSEDRFWADWLGIHTPPWHRISSQVDTHSSVPSAIASIGGRSLCERASNAANATAAVVAMQSSMPHGGYPRQHQHQHQQQQQQQQQQQLLPVGRPHTPVRQHMSPQAHHLPHLALPMQGQPLVHPRQ